MSKSRRQLNTNTSSSVEPKRLSELKDKTGNLYESINIIAKRSLKLMTFLLVMCINEN